MYMLFAGDNYYPAGGWDDFRGFIMADRLSDDELANLKERGFDWYHIASTQGIVHSGRVN